MTNPSELQWVPTNAPAQRRYDDVYFINPSTGWTVNSDGKILATTDGTNWEQQFQTPIDPITNRGIWLRCVGFSTPLNGWVGTVSAEQRLYRTIDGGITWATVDNLPDEAPVKICGLSVVNESVIYASGTNDPFDISRMMKTVDGGETWTSWDMSEHASALIDVYFPTPDRGWVVGGFSDNPNPSRNDLIPVVLFTSDGGATWENRVENIQDSFPQGEWGWKIQFLNARIGFVSLENFDEGAILKTTDGGATWERLPINDPQGNANLEGVGFVNENLGWVGGWGDESFSSGASSQTTNGGDNWEDANQIGQFINRFRFIGDPVTVGYASGQTIYKYAEAPVAVAAVQEVAPPTAFLQTNVPAKFERSVSIEFTLPENTKRATINIWDRFGSHIRTLISETEPKAGQRSVVWDGTDDSGKRVPSGMFIYRLTVDGNAESRMIRLDI